jgi:hypothetical protein
MHELRPDTERPPVEWENVPSLRYLVDPLLDLRGLVGVLFTGDFDSGLELAESDGGEVEVFGGWSRAGSPL